MVNGNVISVNQKDRLLPLICYTFVALASVIEVMKVSHWKGNKPACLAKIKIIQDSIIIF